MNSSRGTSGAPRIWAELRDRGVLCSRTRVARLLRVAGLHGCHRRKGPAPSRRTPGASPVPDLVQRNFTAAAPDRLWVADITSVPTWAGFLSLAVVLDVHSRRVVGWAMADHLRSELVIEALDWSCAQWSMPRIAATETVPSSCWRGGVWAPTLRQLWLDAGYQGATVTGIEQDLGLSTTFVRKPRRSMWVPVDQEPPPMPTGFQLLPRRCVVERTFAWLGRYRRLSKDYETLPATEEAWMYLAMTNLMLARLAK